MAISASFTAANTKWPARPSEPSVRDWRNGDNGEPGKDGSNGRSGKDGRDGMTYSNTLLTIYSTKSINLKFIYLKLISKQSHSKD